MRHHGLICVPNCPHTVDMEDLDPDLESYWYQAQLVPRWDSIVWASWPRMRHTPRLSKHPTPNNVTPP